MAHKCGISEQKNYSIVALRLALIIRESSATIEDLFQYL